LHIHHLLRQRYPDVRSEEGGVGPDFRLYDDDGEFVGGVEELSLFQPAEWTVEERQHGRIADAINARVKPTAGYFIDLQIERADHDPPPRRMATFIRARLAELPPPEELVRALPENPTGSDLPAFMYEETGVRIRVRFMPMRPDAPSRTNPDARIVSTGATIGGIVTTSERMKERIESKAGGRYDLTGRPCLVAVCLHDSFCDDHEILSALYGREAITLPDGRLTRRSGGLFGNDKERVTGRHRRVSAVAVVSWLKIWAPESVDVAIFHNPWGQRAWPHDALPATRRFGPVGEDDGGIQLDWIEKRPSRPCSEHHLA